MLKRPCFVCGTPVRASMCDACLTSRRPQQRKQNPNRPSRQDRGYNAEYDANAKIVIANARTYDLPCHKCGKHFGPEETITVDHVIPRRKGGSNRLENLAPACTRCNYGWRRRRGYV